MWCLRRCYTLGGSRCHISLHRCCDQVFRLARLCSYHILDSCLAPRVEHCETGRKNSVVTRNSKPTVQLTSSNCFVGFRHTSAPKRPAKNALPRAPIASFRGVFVTTLTNQYLHHPRRALEIHGTRHSSRVTFSLRSVLYLEPPARTGYCAYTQVLGYPRSTSRIPHVQRLSPAA